MSPRRPLEKTLYKGNISRGNDEKTGRKHQPQSAHLYFFSLCIIYSNKIYPSLALVLFSFVHRRRIAIEIIPRKDAVQARHLSWIGYIIQRKHIRYKSTMYRQKMGKDIFLPRISSFLACTRASKCGRNNPPKRRYTREIHLVKRTKRKRKRVRYKNQK